MSETARTWEELNDTELEIFNIQSYKRKKNLTSKVTSKETQIMPKMIEYPNEMYDEILTYYNWK